MSRLRQPRHALGVSATPPKRGKRQAPGRLVVLVAHNVSTAYAGRSLSRRWAPDQQPNSHWNGPYISRCASQNCYGSAPYLPTENTTREPTATGRSSLMMAFECTSNHLGSIMRFTRMGNSRITARNAWIGLKPHSSAVIQSVSKAGSGKRSGTFRIVA